DRREQRRPDQRAERRREQRVGEQVVAAVPGVVPQREPDGREQMAAVGGRGQVGALRREQQVHDREQGRERPRGEGSQARAEPPRGRPSGGGGRAHPPLRKAATRSTMSGRSSHAQCPASGYSSSSPPRACAYSPPNRAGM